MSSIQIGWGEASLVPDKKVPLSGQFFERISQYVESPVTATALAIRSESDEAILVSLDIINIGSDVIEMIREEYVKRGGKCDPKKLVFSATHTHTSINTRINVAGGSGFSPATQVLKDFAPDSKPYVAHASTDEDIFTPEEGARLVAERAATAAIEAWDKLEDAYFANEFGRAAVGMCRRVSYRDGSAQMWGDTNRADFVSLEGGNDSGIELLYTFDKKKRLTGVVANLCCPAQILEQRSFISADFWGRTKAELRKALGEEICLLSLCGAAGDQCPRDLVRWVQPEEPIDDPNVSRPNPLPRKADPSMYDVRGCNRVGKRIANEILSVLEEIEEYHSDVPFTHKALTWDLPLRKVTQKDYDESVASIKAYVAENSHKDSFTYEDTARIHVFAGNILRFRLQQTVETVPIETHVIRLGEIAICTNPFELFLDYGNYIKARSAASQTFIAQLTGGSLGYLPTEKAEKAGHYSAYVSSGQIGHEGGDLYVRYTLKEINQLFGGEK